MDQESINPAPTPTFQTCFITTHKNACRVAKFSRDGKLIATGSEDHSIKLLDVDKMKVFNQNGNAELNKQNATRPVLKTYYHHTDRVNDIDFHPLHPIFCSTPDDKPIQFYDIRSSGKRPYKTFNVSKEKVIRNQFVFLIL